MPLFLDSHIVPEGVVLDVETLAEGHARDLAVQEKHGVRYIKYWYDAARGRVFCLVLAPTREAAMAVHWESNGLKPDDIFEVQEFE
jgi:Nickel responsive protein SCO4226-like